MGLWTDCTQRVRRWKRRLAYRVVRQYDTADCGPAVLLSVLRFYGGNASLPFVRELTRTDARGSTVHSLVHAARVMGFDANGATGTYEQLRQQHMPLVAHVVVDTLEHYVVVFEATITHVVIGDPAAGIRTLTREAFEAIWRRHAVILLRPGAHLHHAPPPRWSQYLRTYVVSELPWFQQVIFLGFMYTGLGLLTAAFVQLLLDRFIPSGDTSTIVAAGAVLLAVQVARAGLGYARNRFALELQFRVAGRMNDDFLTHLFALPPQFFTTRRKGDITTRVHDTARIQQALLQVCGQSIVDVVVLVGSIAGMYALAGSVTHVVALFLPILLGAMIGTGRLLKTRQQHVMQRYAAFESGYIDSLTGIDEIRTFGGAPTFAAASLRLATEFQLASRALGRAEAGLFLFTDLVSGAFVVGALAYGGVLVVRGDLRIGELMAVYSLLATIFPAALRLVSATLSVRGASVAASRLLDLLLVERERSTTDRRFALGDHITVQDARFRWSDGTHVLDGATFSICRGQTTGLLGRSGCGKSTLVRILQRKLTLDSGGIVVDDVPLEAFDIESVRRGIAVVPESVKIFNGTVADNILVGRTGIGLDDVTALIQRLGLDSVMGRFDSGLWTIVGEDARRLSSGERQIVGLLRALLDEPDLLVVDEGMSVIDGETARLIADIVVDYGRSHAVLLISHNPTTLAIADSMLMLERGQVFSVPAAVTVQQGVFEREGT